MKPLIIIGAPRSGTNALRDALTSLGSFSTWPCDELNALWRTTNADYPTDALPPALATHTVTATIRGAFANRQAKALDTIVVEKTCANTLRLPFVTEVLPDARFLEIVRDGRDATASAITRWQAPFDLSYSLQKLRWVPRRDVGVVIRRALTNRVRSSNRPPGASVNTWGPIWPGLDGLIEQGADVPTLAAHQWAACASHANNYFASHPDAGSGHLRIRYEELAHNPASTLATIAQWAEAPVSPRQLEAAATTIHAASVGSWERDRGTRAIIEDKLASIIEPVNQSLGYER